MSKKNIDKLSIFALGGVGEIGKNMYVIQYANDIVVVDCGLKFPEEDMLGIDIVIPDISYLTENRDKVRGILITHGHEDHIGGLPYVLKHLNVPIYGTRLTLGLIETKLKEAGLLGETKRHVITADSELKMGCITATFFKTNHSIPDSVGVCLETPEGNVVHTGDFKFDQTPVNDQYADLHKMAAIGQKRCTGPVVRQYELRASGLYRIGTQCRRRNRRGVPQSEAARHYCNVRVQYSPDSAGCRRLRGNAS